MNAEGWPLILVTNDDGISSPGLKAAAEAVLPLGRVIVVAPSRQQSAMGRSHCGDASERLVPVPFGVGDTDVEAYSLAASPALVLSHGLTVLCHGEQPDLVVAGVNYGENLGMNITLSGTVGAALQAAAHGVKALAVSLQTDPAEHHSYADRDWRAAVSFTRRFSTVLLAGALPADVDVLKVDIPASAHAETEWAVTNLSRVSYFSRAFDAPRPETAIGEGYVGRFFDSADVELGSDIDTLLHQERVSVTPLSCNMTSRVDFGELASHLEGNR